MHTHAFSTLNNPVTLIFDLLTSGSLHAELLPYSVCVPSLVLIAQVVFVLERGHTHRQTDKVTDSTISRIGSRWRGWSNRLISALRGGAG